MQVAYGQQLIAEVGSVSPDTLSGYLLYNTRQGSNPVSANIEKTVVCPEGRSIVLPSPKTEFIAFTVVYLEVTNLASTSATVTFLVNTTLQLTKVVPAGARLTYSSGRWSLSAGGSGGGGGSGSVTSVGLTLPNIFSVAGSPITSSGTITATLASQTGNRVFASPNGSSGTPSFRSLVAGDLPTSGVSAGSFTNADITVDVYGRITSVANGSGAGVTSVGLSLPGIFSVSGSPVTSSGTLSASLASQTANTFFAAPNGSSGAPTFRGLLNDDLPTSGVLAGSYANANVIVNSKGIVTSISNGATVPTTYVSGNIVLASPLGYYFIFSIDNAGALVTTATSEPPFTDFVIKAPSGQNYRVTVNDAGAVTTTATTDPATAYSTRIPYTTLTEEDSTYKYYAVAPDNTLPATAQWRVWRRHKVTQVITRADGNRNYDNVGTGLAALSYS